MDGRKRLSGAQYKKQAEEKRNKLSEVLSKTRRVDYFFKKTVDHLNVDGKEGKSYINI